MLPRIWSFIRNSKNREVVSWLGGGAALIVAGGYPTTISSTTAARDEQSRRSALANHVHRIAPMGPPVLLNGTRY